MASSSSAEQQIDYSCITIAEGSIIAAGTENSGGDGDGNEEQQHIEEASANDRREEASPEDTVGNRSNSSSSVTSVSSSPFTNSTSASINSRTALGVTKNNNNNSNKNNSSSKPSTSSSSTAAVVRHQQQQRRVLTFQLNGAVVHRRGANGGSSTKNPIQMLSNLFASMMRERDVRKYGVKRQILQRTRSSLRRPQLVSVRSRGSVHNQKRDMVDGMSDGVDNDDNADSNNNNNNNNKANPNRENAFDMLLRFCDTPADIAFLRNHPDHLERLGIPVEQYSTIFDELNFFLIKRAQLREAEQRVRQRKQKHGKTT